VWGPRWREDLWAELEERREPWDVIVVGGGIAGAGVLREAARRGLSALLVEARDFAWGTSSRSSKLVHGGIRYLQYGHWRLTRESLRERDRLLREAPGLVDPLFFLRVVYERERAQRWLYRAAFLGYGLLAGRRQHAWHDAAEVLRRVPALDAEGLRGAYGYMEAGVDDARLVLRLLREAVRAGGRALSYCPVDALRIERGTVTGVHVRDAAGERSRELRACAVVNATGTAVDRLRSEVGGAARIRPLRGSHLLFHGDRLPLAHGLSFRHRRDGRNVFLAPWEGATYVGTTDVDHDASWESEPKISRAELDYLLESVQACFPSLGLGVSDVVTTWAGVRPVVSRRNADPSAESREGLLVDERGLVTVTGGKITTVRPTALAALEKVRRRCPDRRVPQDAGRLFDPIDTSSIPRLEPTAWRRLLGRHGADAAAVLEAARGDEAGTVMHTPTLWAEVRWAARAEGVTHLEDLLLRRVRLGTVLPEGGAALLPRVKAIVQQELGWSEALWSEEEARYLALWRRTFSGP
jgi:glycerol-3-phosphate dehydrogenase